MWIAFKRALSPNSIEALDAIAYIIKVCTNDELNHFDVSANARISRTDALWLCTYQFQLCYKKSSSVEEGGRC